MKAQKFAATGMAVMTALMLSACTFATPTHISTSSRAEVVQESFTVQDDTSVFTSDVLEGIGREYWATGDGTLNVTVLYDPNSRTNTAMKATDQAARIAKMLRSSGVNDVNADIMPVQQSGDTSQTVINFATIVAQAPSDCGQPLSMEFADFELGNDYKMGCSVETYFAKQIARPKDMLGNDAMDNPDGRRNANVTERYRMGEQMKELEGEAASEE